MPNHLIVLMMENRSFDNMLGRAYDRDKSPTLRIPDDGRSFFGLDFDQHGSPLTGTGNGYWNPSNHDFFSERHADPVKATIAEATNFTMPDPDPGEHFDRITAQIFGPGRPATLAGNGMLGFLLDFAESAGSAKAGGILHYYAPAQVPVITALARNFAVCDRWFASSPTQTLPNRSFVHAGTSNGKVNNTPYNPFDFDVRTIFNVLEESRIPWAVYKDTHLHGLEKFCGTRVQFPQLWPRLLDGHFKHLDDFQTDLDSGDALPKYCFLEPRLLVDGNDQHPPRDIRLGEQLIYDVYESIRQSGRTDILLLITYDEHGGCYDHVPPPFGAVPPDSHPGELGFGFDRFGVRVPAVLVSPFIEEGTVFRSDKVIGGQEIPFDHTSILATLQKLLQIQPAAMLPSARIAKAPTFDHVLTRATPRSMPVISPPNKVPKIERLLDFAEQSNDLQIALAMGLTRWADQVQGTRAADDPALPAKLKDRLLLIPHVIEEVRRIKAKQSPAPASQT